MCLHSYIDSWISARKLMAVNWTTVTDLVVAFAFPIYVHHNYIGMEEEEENDCCLTSLTYIDGFGEEQDAGNLPLAFYHIIRLFHVTCGVILSVY